MKLLFAFVQNEDVKSLTRALIKCDINVTRISSSGGFLSSGNSTLLIGVEEAELQNTLDIIKKHSHKRGTAMAAQTIPSMQGITTPLPISVTIGGATVFVVDVESFHKF
jgi:uncharacterized protein YaaQ